MSTDSEAADYLVAECKKYTAEQLAGFLKGFLNEIIQNEADKPTDDDVADLSETYRGYTTDAQKHGFFMGFMKVIIDSTKEEPAAAAHTPNTTGTGAAAASAPPIWSPQYFEQVSAETLPTEGTERQDQKQIWWIGHIQRLLPKAKEFRNFLVTLVDVYVRIPNNKKNEYEDRFIEALITAADNKNTEVQKYSGQLANITEAEYNRFRNGILAFINPITPNTDFHKIAAVLLDKYTNLTPDEKTAAIAPEYVDLLTPFFRRWIEVKDNEPLVEEPFRDIKLIINTSNEIKDSAEQARILVTFMRDAVARALYPIMIAVYNKHRGVYTADKTDELSSVDAEKKLYNRSLIGSTNNTIDLTSASAYKSLDTILTKLNDATIIQQQNPNAYIETQMEHAYMYFDNELKSIGEYYLNIMPTNYYYPFTRGYKVTLQERSKINKVRYDISESFTDPLIKRFLEYYKSRGIYKSYDEKISTDPRPDNYYEITANERVVRWLMQQPSTGAGGGGAASRPSTGAGGGGVPVGHTVTPAPPPMMPPTGRGAAAAPTIKQQQDLSAAASTVRQILAQGPQLAQINKLRREIQGIQNRIYELSRKQSTYSELIQGRIRTRDDLITGLNKLKLDKDALLKQLGGTSRGGLRRTRRKL